MSIESAFREHVDALRDLGSVLEAAASIRYEASPGMVGGGDGPRDPTLDTVLDPRRSAVSSEITRATVELWPMTRTVIARTEQLRTAVARWEGEAATTSQGLTP